MQYLNHQKRSSFKGGARLSRGFSLIELIVTMTIIGLLVGITVVWPGRSINLNAQVEQLAYDVRYTQFLAMTLNEKIRLNFSTNHYRLSNLDDTIAILFPAIDQDTITLEGGTALSVTGLTNQYIVFDGLGIPYVDAVSAPGGQPLVGEATLLLAAEGRVRAITIFPETGKVRIQDE